MRIETHREERLIIIKLIGRYDIEEVHDFVIMFRQQINMNLDIIALNLSELNYIDSSGIGSFIRCKNTATRNRVQFICYDLHKNIASIFKLAKVDQFLDILSEDEFIQKSTLFTTG